VLWSLAYVLFVSQACTKPLYQRHIWFMTHCCYFLPLLSAIDVFQQLFRGWPGFCTRNSCYHDEVRELTRSCYGNDQSLVNSQATFCNLCNGTITSGLLCNVGSTLFHRFIGVASALMLSWISQGRLVFDLIGMFRFTHRCIHLCLNLMRGLFMKSVCRTGGRFFFWKLCTFVESYID